MRISLNKILLLGTSSEEVTGKDTTPLSNWLRKNESAIKFKSNPSDTDRDSQYSANMVFGSERKFFSGQRNYSEINTTRLNFNIQNNRFLHLVVALPVIFILVFGLCIILLFIFDRRDLKENTERAKLLDKESISISLPSACQEASPDAELHDLNKNKYSTADAEINSVLKIAINRVSTQVERNSVHGKVEREDSHYSWKYFE